MSELQHLLDNNRDWAASVVDQNPRFFKDLAEQQTPEYLWIGCSDSRVAANTIVDVMPGEVFVHRNVANLVVHTDMNCLSVIQFAVEVLNVKHIIVCGHYGCGGVKAAFEGKRQGLIDNWLRHIQDTLIKYEDRINDLPDDRAKLNTLCELSVTEQVFNVCQTTVVQEAWDRGQKVTVHGWVYDLVDGIIDDLDISISNDEVLRRLRAISFIDYQPTRTGEASS